MTQEKVFITLSENELRKLIKEETQKAINETPIQIPRQEDFLSTRDVCSLLGVSQQTRNEWTKLGYIKAYKLGGKVLYKLTEVEEAMQQICKYKPKNR